MQFTGVHFLRTFASGGCDISYGCFFSSRRRHTRLQGDWSSDVCSSDLPYFHNGGQATLEQVVDFYNRGGDFPDGGVGPDIRRLGLSATERASLVAFLKSDRKSVV